ncbi:MAG: PAS domain S-box protein [Chloroflexaceae bacterium]|nr:PAS domain S-box protein [Chloroflexaceae bacterium]
MMSLSTLFLVLLAGSVGLSLLFVVFALRHQHTPGALAFALILLGESIWATGYFFELLVPSPSDKIILDNLQFIGTDSIAVASLLFALTYTGRTTWSHRLSRLLWALPILNVLVVWTDPFHHLLRQSIAMVIHPDLSVLSYPYGPWMWINVGYSYTLVLASIAVLLPYAIRAHRHYQLQALVVLLGLSVGMVTSLFTVAGLVPLPDLRHLDISPITFALTNPLLAWGLFRQRLLDLVPIARDVLVEHMPDGMMVLDRRRRVVDINPGAQALLNQTATALIGRPVEQVMPVLTSLLSTTDDRVALECELPTGLRKRLLWVEITANQVRDRRSRLTGWLIMMRDRTLQYEIQVALRKSETSLSRAQAIAHLGSWEWDLQATEAQWSDETYRIFGMEPGDHPLTLAAMQGWIHPEDRTATIGIVRETIATRKPTAYEHRIIQPDGRVRCLQGNCEVVCDEHGNAARLVGTVQDITDRKEMEEHLRVNQTRLQAIVDSAGVGIVVADESGRYTFFNRYALETIGYTLEEISQMSPFGLIHPDDVETARTDMEQVLSGAINGYRRERRYRCKDGRFLWVDTTTTAIRSAQGNLVSVVGILVDITERKHAEDAMQRSEARYRLLAETMSDVVWTMDPEGNFTYVSPSVVALRGYTPEEVLQQALSRALTPESFQLVQARFGAFGHNGSYEIRPIELEQPRKDGTTVWTETVATPILDAEGSLTGWVGVSRDITERRRMEDRVRKLSRAVEQSSSSVVITDSTGAIEYVNPYFTQVAGYTAEEAHGQNPRILKAGTMPPEVYENLWRTILSGENWRGELHNRKKNGELYWEFASIAPIFNEAGRITHFVAVKEDITQRKRMEAELHRARETAEAASHTKSAFLANMSHELRTPLNAILGFAQVMGRSHDLSEEHREYLAIISRSGEHLLTLINEVLDMSKIEAGYITLNETVCHLGPLLSDLEKMFQLRAQEKGLWLTFKRGSGVPHAFRTDEQKLRQVLINLVSNAIKFTNTGGVRLQVRCQGSGGGCPRAGRMAATCCAPHPDPCPLIFEVTDTGTGIAPGELDQIFEAFVQARNHQPAQEGTGLGLPISRKFAQMMGGDITVQSVVGRGSVFTLTITATVAEAERETRKTGPRRMVGLAPDQPPPRVLVADDRLDNRRLLVDLLAGVGFVVREASNGQEAIALWEAWDPHLIWMDVQMPVMGGREAAQHIKAAPGGCAPVIIAISAGAFEEDQAAMLAAGCEAFVRKPFRDETVFEVMAHYLGIRYLYADDGAYSADETGDGPEPGFAPTLTPELLAALSPERVQGLHHAAMLGDVRMLAGLIEQMHGEQGVLAGVLHHLVETFRLDQIVAATEAALGGPRRYQ